jgi:hypothetical protein
VFAGDCVLLHRRQSEIEQSPTRSQAVLSDVDRDRSVVQVLGESQNWTEQDSEDLE